MVSLSSSVVTSTATATASLDGGGSYAVAEADGIDAESSNYDSTVTLDGASVTATATATHTGTDGEAFAITNGIYVDAEQQAIISLSNGLTVTATSTATATATGGSAEAEAIGIEFGAPTSEPLAEVAIMQVEANEKISVTLDNSSVTATATATGETSSARATGIDVGNTDATIDLTNGSVVSATATASDPTKAYAAAIHVRNVPDATINIDATSSVLSSDYAIYSDGGEGGGNSVTVNNSGFISGRLQVEELNNSATGVLEATLSTASASLLVDQDLDGDVDADDRVLTTSYNTVVNTATLAAGSTVAIKVNDPSSIEGGRDYGLGLTQPGDSEQYRILTAGTGAWVQSNVNLGQSTGRYYSPMLSLTWSGLSDANNLVMGAAFLTPAQAGLSKNATAAFNAAYADKLFNFYSSPEDWIPDVSGANLYGKTQFIGSTQRRSIESRLASLSSGVNSGDGMEVHGAWADVRYTDANQDEQDDIEGFDADTTSLTLGYDYQVNTATTLGLAFSYGTSDVETDVSKEEFDMDDYLVTLYGGYDADSWFAEGQLSYGFGDVDGERTVFTSRLNASYDSNVYYARIAGGLKYALSGWTVSPKASLDYTRVKFDDYTEKGGNPFGMKLRVDNEDYDSSNIGVGVQMRTRWNVGESMHLTPDLGAMIFYDIIGDEVETTSTFVGGTTSFVTKGADADETSYSLAASMTLGSVNSALSFKLGYEFIGRNDFESHNVNAKFRYEF